MVGVPRISDASAIPCNDSHATGYGICKGCQPLPQLDLDLISVVGVELLREPAQVKQFDCGKTTCDPGGRQRTEVQRLAFGTKLIRHP